MNPVLLFSVQTGVRGSRLCVGGVRFLRQFALLLYVGDLTCAVGKDRGSKGDSDADAYKSKADEV